MPIDPERIAELRACEDARFIEQHPRSMALLERGRATMPAGVPMGWMRALYAHPPIFLTEAKGTYLTDVDGHRYLDMNLADTSMACGYGLEVVAEAVTAQFLRGSQYLLPNEETLQVTEALAARFEMPRWQFTLAATSANGEAIRIARAFTGRDRVLVFDGKYHGMLDETCHEPGEGGVAPEMGGLPRDAGKATDIVPYNDLAAAEQVLARGETAVVLVEAAATNVGGVLMPNAGFLAGLRALTQDHGAVLVIDEAHTHVCAYGGLKRAWQLDCDILVLGKAVAGGIPAGLYGLSEELAAFLETTIEGGTAGYLPPVAVGGTLFGNPLQIASIRATLEHVLTEEAHAKAAALGEQLAQGIEAGASKRGLAWSAHRLYCRSGYHFAETLPTTNTEARAAFDPALRDLMRIYMLNRGVFEAVYSASPAVSLAAEAADVALYLQVYEACLEELTA
ncbi:MAG: aminotransferase class III-fold pyridoxal phosphate-dependent enzyme [Pseudomonadota bacterium]